MNVQELFRRLSLGELSNLGIGNDGAGTIKESGKPKIIMLANDGLRALYARFILREKTLILDLKPNIASYNLRPIHALSQVAEDNDAEAYIVDSVEEPFTGDLIRVLEAYDNLGQPFVLNNADDPMSLFTPQPDVLQIPNPLTGQLMAVTYQAKSIPLVDGNENQAIDLPEILESILTAFIAHKVYSQMNTPEAAVRSKYYFDIYEMGCLEIEQKNLLGSSRSSSQKLKFNANGWV